MCVPLVNAYTRTGQQKSVENDEAGYGFKYLANGQLDEEYVSNTVTVVDALGATTSQDYEYVFTRNARDSAGRPNGYGLFEGNHHYDIVTAPIVQLVDYSYNADGLLDTVSSDNRTFSYKYYPQTALDNGRSLTYNSATLLDVTRTLESQRMLVDTVKNRWGGETGTLISFFDYTNDAAGRRVGRDDDGLAFNTTVAIPNTFGYDLKSQVTGATMNNNSDNYAYIYDQIGNRLVARKNGVGIVYEPNELNQYDAISDELTAADGSGLEQADPATTVEPLFDDDGNMTLNVGASSGWTYVWNGENRLIKARAPGDKVEFVYDHQGRRIQKKVYSWNPSDYSDPDGEPTVSNHIFVYIYDGWNLIAELEVNSSFPIQNSSFYYPTFDANGNVSEYVKKGTQATFVADDIVAQYEYDPFGNRTDGFTDTVAFAHRFSTKYLDPETDLYYYGYRYYSPELGRWFNRDPIEEQGGMNLYALVRNRVGNSVDIKGLVELFFSFSDEGGHIINDDIYPVGHDWKHESLAGTSGFSNYIKSRTKVSCKGVPCGAADIDNSTVVYPNACMKIVCTIHLATYIRITKRFTNSISPIRENVYGHEQRHVRNWRYAAKYGKTAKWLKKRDTICYPKRSIKRMVQRLEGASWGLRREVELVVLNGYNPNDPGHYRDSQGGPECAKSYSPFRGVFPSAPD